MSLQEIKQELVGLNPQEQAEVSGFLFHLRHAADASYQATLQRRMDDKDPTHWLTPDEFERRANQG